MLTLPIYRVLGGRLLPRHRGEHTMTRDQQNHPGVAVYASTSGPQVYLSPNAQSLPPREQANLMRQAALALRTAARERAPRGPGGQ